MTRKWTANRSATERLARVVKTALADQKRAGEEVAREARLPSKVFQSLLRHGRRPSLDRADEVCRALGITMTIGSDGPNTDDEP